MLNRLCSSISSKSNLIAASATHHSTQLPCTCLIVPIDMSSGHSAIEPRDIEPRDIEPRDIDLRDIDLRDIDLRDIERQSFSSNRPISVEPTEPSRIKKAQPPRFQWTNPDVLVGFPQTAHFLAADPDKSTVIFKRFDKVSTRNLLNLEGRVAALEAVQERLDREDNTKNWKNIHIAAVAQSWEDFALLGTEMGLRSSSMKIPHGVYERWNQSREKRLKAEEKDAQKKRGGPVRPAIQELRLRLVGRLQEDQLRPKDFRTHTAKMGCGVSYPRCC